MEENQNREQTLAEKFGVTYHEGADGMMYPNLELGIPEEENRPVGKYGLLRRSFLEKHRPGQYSAKLLDCTLQKHLMDVDSEAKEMLATLMKQLLQANPPPPQGTMEWVQHMNGLKHQAEEVIFQELIYK